MQNTVYTLLSTLAPLSGLIQSKFDILLEPTSLLPQHPLHHPVVAVKLKAPTKAKSSILALDIIIAPVPPHLPSQPQLNNPTSIPEAHLYSIRSKLCGCTHGSHSNQQVIAAINRENITILPFTVDHLGGIGYFSHLLLFGAKPNLSEDRFPHPAAFSACQTLLHSPSGFLQKANKAWEVSPY
jgi:hypothetical protein